MWNREYPAQLTFSDITGLERYLAALGNVSHFVLYSPQGDMKGWAALFDREDERWFAIILDRDVQRLGWGSQLLARLQQQYTTLCGWVTDHNMYVRQDGTPYPSPVAFYLKNGFAVTAERLRVEQMNAVKIIWHRPAGQHSEH
jgi:ribosomal protein S18 acetylase RimI-like enzyme